MNIHNDILSTIGATPMVRINSIVDKPGVEVYAKLEGVNPSGSIKDRIALKMLEQAELEGALTHGKTIIEATSGNTGIALAMLGAVKGYDVEIIMSEAVSEERRKMIRAFGAKVILTDADSGTDGAIRELKRRVAEQPERYFTPDQFSNRYNKLAHYITTAEEILRDTDARITHYVAALGTSGTLMGVGKRLKEVDSRIEIVAAEPVRNHRIQGLKNMNEAIVPEIYDESAIDRFIMIENEAAFNMSRRLAREEGVFAGMSSGAAMHAACELAKTLTHGVIVVIFPDKGEKYLSTSLFA